MTKRKIILIAHDIRSTHNVGAFFRTCDGLGVDEIIFSGYTPYPTFEGDSRLPHFADKLTRQIHKTALGAESTIPFERYESLDEVMDKLRTDNFVLIALEQAAESHSPSKCRQIIDEKYLGRPIALLVGNEIHGVAPDALKQMDLIMGIPMRGSKESLNVSVATAIALYELTK